MKTGDKVKIISAPVVHDNEYGQLQIDKTIGYIGNIQQVYKNGDRPIVVAGYSHSVSFFQNYYNPENLELIP